MFTRLRVLCVAVPALFLTVAAVSQEGPYPVRVIVRADAKGEIPTLTASDLRVTFNGHPTPVQRVEPLIGRAGKPLQLAILIDDGLRTNFGNQVADIQRFAASMASSGVQVGIAYMQNGRAVFSNGGFSSDPDVVGKQLRLPMATPGASASPYFCLQDLVKNWPGDRTGPRVVLMITNGIDPYNGSVAPSNQNSPYVDAAIADAQKADVPVYSIYFGRFDVNPGFGSFSGQNYLTEVADGTGGVLYNQGTLNPPSIAPFFKKFERDLRESYVLTFQTGAKKPAPVKVYSDHGVKIRAQKMASPQM